MEQVKIGKVYRHFKGNYYFVRDIALDSETQERMVVYQAIYDRPDCQLWVRPEKMFLEKVKADRPGNITGQTDRFKLVTDIEKNYID